MAAPGAVVVSAGRDETSRRSRRQPQRYTQRVCMLAKQRFPWGIVAMVTLCISFFAASCAIQDLDAATCLGAPRSMKTPYFDDALVYQVAHCAINKSDVADLRSQAWRPFTGMFMHHGFTHLIVNIVALAAYGVELEWMNGAGRVMTVFVVGGTVGLVVGQAVLAGVVDSKFWGRRIVGASGGVYAVLGCAIVNHVINQDSMVCWMRAIRWGAVIVIMGSEVIMYLLSPDPYVAHDAHIAGFVTGVVLGAGVLRNMEPQPWERWTRRAVIVLGGGGLVSLLLFAILAPVCT